ncbi:unnamed protein product, partial [Allacma fusca]
MYFDDPDRIESSNYCNAENNTEESDGPDDINSDDGAFINTSADTSSQVIVTINNSDLPSSTPKAQATK